MENCWIKTPFYYGWVILVLGILCFISSIPGQTAGFAAFTDKLIKDLNINRETLSFAYFIGTICSGLILPQMGKILDQSGVRIFGTSVTIIFGFSLVVMSFAMSITSQIHSWVIKFISIHPQIITVSFLITGFFFIRFLGQGLLPLMANTMIGKWFEKQRGMAFSFVGVANTIAFSVSPVALASFISLIGWQWTWRSMGLIIFSLMSFLIWGFARKSPESCGFTIDGKNVNSSQKQNQTITGLPSEIAIKTLPFWTILLILTTQATTITAVTFHITKMGQLHQMTSYQSLKLFTYAMIISIPLSLIISYNSQKIGMKNIIRIMLTGQIVYLISLISFGQSFFYWLCVIGLGMSNGCFGPLNSLGIPTYFGRKYLGTIHSKLLSTMVIGSSLGPMIYAFHYKYFNHFNALFLVTLFCPFILLFFFF